MSACVGPYLDCMNGVCDHGPENGSTGLESTAQSMSGGEPTYTLTGLSGAHMEAIVQGLWDTIHHEYSEETDREQAHAVLQFIAESNYP